MSTVAHGDSDVVTPNLALPTGSDGSQPGVTDGEQITHSVRAAADVPSLVQSLHLDAHAGPAGPVRFDADVHRGVTHRALCSARRVEVDDEVFGIHRGHVEAVLLERSGDRCEGRLG